MKRILLFVMTNLAVVVVLGIVANLLGVNRYLTANGLNLGALLGFALIMGFGGAIISLLISKPVAKWSAGVRIIEQPQNADEAAPASQAPRCCVGTAPSDRAPPTHPPAVARAAGAAAAWRPPRGRRAVHRPRIGRADAGNDRQQA